MRAVVQRSSSSQVEVAGTVVGRIEQGLAVLLGIKKGDDNRQAEYIMDKIIHLRIFEDDEGKMNRSLQDIKGDILLVSQFTLYGDARKGRRPGFSDAAAPEQARPVFDYCVQYLQERGVKVETGVFGAEMLVTIGNEGPCTVLLDSEKEF